MKSGKSVMQLALAALSLLVVQYAGAQELLPDRNPQLFTQAVHILGGNRNLSVRWHSEVRYQVVSADIPAATTFVDTLFTELSQLTGTKSRRIDNDSTSVSDYLDGLDETPRYSISDCDNFNSADCANFVIIITSQETMHAIATRIPLRPVFQKATAQEEKLFCFFSPGVSPQRVIRQGFVFIDESLDELMLQTCLQEEIYQSFGMFNDYSNSPFFSFDNVVLPKTITRYDRALLASLYDPLFPAGTMVNRIALHMINTEIGARRKLLAEAP